MQPSTVTLGFIGSAAAVVVAGVWLARSGDVIAARTRLGGLWVGALFLAVATSLPEFTTDIAAVRLGVPDLAAGDLFGSSMANMLILALVSMMPRAKVFQQAALDNGLAASLAIVLTAAAALFVLLRPEATLLGVGPGSLVLAVAYGFGMRAVFRNSALAREAAAVVETGQEPPGEAPAGGAAASLRRAVIVFVIAALVILVAAPLFAASAKALAELTGLATTFVGTWLVGFATSLPELVTSVSAVRIRAYDLAVGNLFGSNAVNMVMFAPLDLAYGRGPILGAISPVHALSALLAIILMGLGLAAIVYRARGRFAMLEPSALLMVLVYVLGIAMIFLRTSAL